MSAIAAGAGYAASGRLVAAAVAGGFAGLGAFWAQRWSLGRRQREGDTPGR